MPFHGGGVGGSTPTVIPTIHKEGAVLNYLAAIAEGTTTFTPAVAIEFDNYECIIIDLDLEGSGVGDLRMQVNGDASANYETDGTAVVGGVETIINETLQTSWRLLIGIAATSPVCARIIIMLSQGGSEDNPSFIMHMRGGAGFGDYVLSGDLNVNKATITSVTIFMTASTWKIGTRMTFTPITRLRYQIAAP